MQNYEELYKSVPIERANELKKKIDLIKSAVPEIWELLISKQRICPCDFCLPNFCVPEPKSENCKRCWEQALKFPYDSGISVSPAGYLICAKCKRHLFLKSERNEYDLANDKAKKSAVWMCPKCKKEFDLGYGRAGDIKDQARPQGWQPGADRVVEPDDVDM